ncbi:elastin-like [Photinus pyralis]|uniref:elastin-like n=1 Tax=Photinus pyralis TaxID=7054 RepID=UPI001267296E|nr:elastin-like [Photinus pyralis]
MKYLAVVFSFAALAAARPELPSGSYLPTGGHIGSFESSGSHINGISGGFGGIGGISGIGGIGGIGSIGGIGGIGGFQQDQKHVYFYAAPEEEHASRLRINIVPNSQRNTKIIFVKAPSYGGVVPEVIAPPSLSEDKTLVYVLVKRPQDGGQITIPAGAGVKQAKPEVFFIKYKSQHDAEAAIRGGLNGQAVGSSVSDLGNESSFVRTLASGSHGHGAIGDSGFGGGFGHIGGGIIGTGGAGAKFGPAGESGPY